MTCEKTGAVIYLQERNEWCRGDAFRVGDVLIFRINQMSLSRHPKHSVVHYRVTKIAESWPSSLCVESRETAVVVALDRHAIYYGYDGRTPVKLMEDPE